MISAGVRFELALSAVEVAVADEESLEDASRRLKLS